MGHLVPKATVHLGDSRGEKYRTADTAACWAEPPIQLVVTSDRTLVTCLNCLAGRRQ